MLEAIRSMFTDTTGAVDALAVRDFCNKVRGVAVDGASCMFKAVCILAGPEYFPNLVFRFRDHAHAVRTGTDKCWVGRSWYNYNVSFFAELPGRIALQKPCAAESTVAEMRNRLFGQHGIVPDLKHSIEWRTRFQAIQASCSPNEKAFRSISWSAIRFDSESDPCRTA